jgi:hypothetical protein
MVPFTHDMSTKLHGCASRSPRRIYRGKAQQEMTSFWRNSYRIIEFAELPNHGYWQWGFDRMISKITFACANARYAALMNLDRPQTGSVSFPKKGIAFTFAVMQARGRPSCGTRENQIVCVILIIQVIGCTDTPISQSSCESDVDICVVICQQFWYQLRFHEREMADAWIPTALTAHILVAWRIGARLQDNGNLGNEHWFFESLSSILLA